MKKAGLSENFPVLARGKPRFCGCWQEIIEMGQLTKEVTDFAFGLVTWHCLLYSQFIYYIEQRVWIPFYFYLHDYTGIIYSTCNMQHKRCINYTCSTLVFQVCDCTSILDHCLPSCFSSKNSLMDWVLRWNGIHIGPLLAWVIYSFWFMYSSDSGL